MAYNVGDRVRYILEEGEFEVKATREIPYQHQGGEVRVEGENDYVIVKCGTNQFEGFIQVPRGLVEDLDH